MKTRFMLPALMLVLGAQLSSQPAMAGAASPSSSAIEVESTTPEWAFSALLSGYSVPEDHDYLSPLFAADRGWLHLEGRYNYEALDSGSLWLGRNFSFGERWTLDCTPMVGFVFGESRGIAPGWRLALGRGAFEFTSEAEFMFDSRGSSESFFYAWSEMTWSFTESFWAGLALQRTRVRESGLEIQRGFLVGVTVRGVDLTAYVFNWGWEEPTLVFSVGMEF